MAKPKLTTLKPRLAALRSPLRPLSSSGSWRAGKNGATARGYSYKWEKARERFLRLHPLCCYCEATGQATAATIVDHRIPHRGDERLFWDEANWQPMCKPCHDGHKQREDRQA